MSDEMNGAESLVRTLIAGGVDVCFTNPGTSEMHFVAALDKVPGMRCILGLFEGVVTGAADGYYRMSGKPASTLLHLAPGLANGLANLHNAKKADSGIVNIVGEHATHHIKFDAPLTADIEGTAAPMSHWVKTSPTSATIADDGALAIEVARQTPGQIATLILPADTAWGPADTVGETNVPPAVPKVSDDAVKAAAEMLRNSERATLLMGGAALRERPLELAGRIAAKTGCGILAEGANTRLARGAGRVQVNRIPYVVELAQEVMKKAGNLVLVGSREPVAFFAYPDKPSLLMDPEALAAELDCLDVAPAGIAAAKRSSLPTGEITLPAIANALSALMPEDAIVVDESITSGREFFPSTAGAPPHDWMNNRGGSIGYGMPVSVGAAVACPDRKVIALVGDGSAMYTVQSLWTMAREGLDITILIFSNGSYNILRGELTNVGVQNPGPRAVDMLSIDRPDLDWVSMAKSMGVEAARCRTAEDLVKAMDAGLHNEGPYLIEVAI